MQHRNTAAPLVCLLVLVCALLLAIAPGCGDNDASTDPPPPAAQQPADPPGEAGVRAAAERWEIAWIGMDRDSMMPLLAGPDELRQGHAEMMLAIASGFELNRVMLDRLGPELVEQATGEKARSTISAGDYRGHTIELNDDGQTARRYFVLIGMWPMHETWQYTNGRWQIDTAQTLNETLPLTQAKRDETSAAITMVRNSRQHTTDLIKRLEADEITTADELKSAMKTLAEKMNEATAGLGAATVPDEAVAALRSLNEWDLGELIAYNSEDPGIEVSGEGNAWIDRFMKEIDALGYKAQWNPKLRKYELRDKD